VRWLVIFVLLIIAGFLQGCSTLEKRINKAKVVARENPNSFASFCVESFPVKEKFIKGKDSIVIDTLIQEKIVKVPVIIKGDTTYVDVKCPKATTVYKTVVRIDTVIKEDTAKLADLRQQIDKSNKDYKEKDLSLQKALKSSTSRLYWIIGLAILALLAIVIIFKK